MLREKIKKVAYRLKEMRNSEEPYSQEELEEEILKATGIRGGTIEPLINAMVKHKLLEPVEKEKYKLKIR